MNPYGVDTIESNIQGPICSLDVLYESMPATSGCEACEKKHGKDKDWCCLLPDVLVYTELGPVPIKNIKVGDNVWTKSGLRSVAKVGKRKVSEKIVDLVSCYGRTISLTADHEILVDQYSRKNREKAKPLEFVAAESLTPKRAKKLGHYLIFPKFDDSPFAEDPAAQVMSLFANSCGGNITISEVADVFVQNGNCFNTKSCRGTPIDNNFGIGQDEAWIFGLYLAEGCTETGSVNFNIHEDETQLFQNVIHFAESCGVNASWKINRGKSLTIRVFSRVLVKLFDALCGKYCDQKRISSVLMRELLRNYGLRRSFMDGYYAGDGTKKLSKKMAYSIITTSKELAHQALFLNWSLGRFCGLYTHRHSGKKTSYTLSDSNGKYHDYVETESDFRVPIRSKRYRQYDGYVFDIEIEDEESFLTECGEVHNCKGQSPSLYYVEFLKVYGSVQKWAYKQRKRLILRALRNYLDNNLSKGCIFYDDGCTTYEDRPLICRLYGIIPDETWKVRWEHLKSRQKDKFEAKPQCDMVTAEKEVTAELESKWLEHALKCEQRIGVPDNQIHDNAGGSYRTFHDHLLLELFEESTLAFLTQIRLANPSQENIDLTIDQIKELI